MGYREDLISWIDISSRRGFNEKKLRDRLLKAGHSTSDIDLAFSEYNKKDKKKSRRGWVKGVVMIAVLVICLFFINTVIRDKELNRPRDIDNSDKWAFPRLETDPKKIINISDNQYVNSILTPTLREIWPNRPNCVSEEDALIYLVHIKRAGAGYEFNCSFGKYQTFQPYKEMGKEGIYYASIEDCSPDVIRSIDESILMGGDCRFPLAFPEKLEGLEFDEYYAFYLGCERITLDSSYIQFLRSKLPCFYFLSDEQADSLVGEEMNILGFGGIIIPSLNMVIY